MENLVRIKIKCRQTVLYETVGAPTFKGRNGVPKAVREINVSQWSRQAVFDTFRNRLSSDRPGIGSSGIAARLLSKYYAEIIENKS
jgi:hypothetical protein